MISGGRTVKLDNGLEVLEKWADKAGPAPKNVLYKALFAVTEGSVFHRYGVLQDTENANDFFVLIREDLVLKISYMEDGESFGIRYIGHLEEAPGLDVVLDRLTESP